MNVKQLISLFLIIFYTISAQAQDEIWLLNGQKKKVSALEFSDDNLLIRYQNEKGKTKLISTKDVFSVTTSDNKEHIYYKPTNGMSVVNMKEYMLGEIDAGSYIAKDEFFINLFLGFQSPIAYGKLAAVAPITFSFVLGQTTPNMSKFQISDKSEFYINGYKRVVRKKRLVSSLLGGGIGLLLGVSTVYLIN